MKRWRAKRSGVTLIELLVVATIILTVAAVSVPAIKPMLEAQVTSNAATTVSTYLNRARARATSTGRPCGVTFEVFQGTYDDFGTPDDPSDDVGSASLVLRQVEVPPYYCGLEEGATVSVRSGEDFYDADGCASRPVYTDDAYWSQFVASEESPKIQFDSTGPFYELHFGDGATGAYIRQIPGVEFPTRNNVPFKVIRDPRATMTAPIGLAQDTVVDLEFSGSDNNFFTLGSDVTVVFGPAGNVDCIVDGSGKAVPSGPIYFLIGRWERISALAGYDDAGNVYDYKNEPSATDDGLWNFDDATNFWVSINPTNGLVTSSPVNSPVNQIVGEGGAGLITESREFARTSKRNLGGR